MDASQESQNRLCDEVLLVLGAGIIPLENLYKSSMKLRQKKLVKAA